MIWLYMAILNYVLHYFSFLKTSKLNIFVNYKNEISSKQYKNEFFDEKEAKRFFEVLLFFNAAIEKTYIKRLSNINLLHELSFFNDLSIVKISSAFKGYARRYNIEIIDSKEPFVQLTISKPSIENLLKIY